MSIPSEGRVSLIGAGPGDPDLITVKGLRLLKKADVVLYDLLAHPSLLSQCKHEALLINVGKKKGHHLKTQEEINQLLVKYAKKGNHVVRLKGGDPLLFGRGGEEMAFLKQQGIVYDVVPGISSPSGIAAYCGLPLTHRTLSRSVAFVTGSYKQGDSIEDLHVPNAETIVFFMGLTHIHTLVDQLLKHPLFTMDTPVAFVYRGTFANQQVCISTLGTCVGDAKAFKTPLLWIVGHVVSTMDSVSWRDHLPLSGTRIVIARSANQNEKWAAALSDLGAEVVTYPLIRCVANKNGMRQLTLTKINRATILIFTSSNGVAYFFDTLKYKQIDSRILSNKSILAVGTQSAQALLNYGIFAASQPPFQQEGIMEMMRDRDLTKDTVLIPTASKTRPDLVQWLLDKQAKVLSIPLYTTEMIHPSYWPIQEGDYVWFTSSSTAEAFFTHPQCPQTLNITACCLGPITAATVAQFFTGPCLVSDHASFESLAQLTCTRVRRP